MSGTKKKITRTSFKFTKKTTKQKSQPKVKKNS
jgi:hypothetical protein